MLKWFYRSHGSNHFRKETPPSTYMLTLIIAAAYDGMYAHTIIYGYFQENRAGMSVAARS